MKLKKYLMAFGIVFLLFGFSNAIASYNSEEGQTTIKIPINQGWNLLPTLAAEAVSSESPMDCTWEIFPYEYVYLPVQGRTVLVRDHQTTIRNPDNQYGEWITDGEELYITPTYSYWVYSLEEGELWLNFNEEEFNFRSLSNEAGWYNMKSGWNFAVISPGMERKNIMEMSGTCDILKSYMLEPTTQGWDDLSEREFSNDDVGKSMIIKVSDDCKLGTSLAEIPEMPNFP